MEQSSKTLRSLTARVVSVWSQSDSAPMVKVRIEVAAGYDDGTAAAKLDIALSYGGEIVTGRTDDFGVALLEFYKMYSQLGGQIIGSTIKMQSPVKFTARAKGYSAIAEVALPLSSLERGKTYYY